MFSKIINTQNTMLASALIRVGLAFAFIYVSISSFVIPDAWIGFTPEFIFNILPISQKVFLNLHAVGEFILGLWLLSGRKTFWAALASAVTLFFIVVFNLGAFLIVFRDVSLLMAALALAVLEKQNR